MAIPALLAAAPGLIKAGASLFGGKKRRRAEQQAQAAQTAAKERVQNFQFKNPYANLENTAEDLTVNQQATNVQAQQTDQALAQGLDAITAGGGGGGDAQAIANAALQSKQNISADLAGQEAGIQQQVASQAAANQSAEAQGAANVQQQQFGQAQQGFNIANTELGAAKDARAQARQDLVGGLAGAAGAGISALQNKTNTPSPVARLNHSALKRMYGSPLKNVEGEEAAPQLREYGGSAGERAQLLDRLAKDRNKSIRFRSGEGGQYTIDGKNYNIKRGNLLGGDSRATAALDKYLGEQAKGYYQADYDSELRDRGLKSSEADAAFTGARGAAQDAQIADASLNAYATSGDTGAGRTVDNIQESALPRTPLYRFFKMKYKGMYK